MKKILISICAIALLPLIYLVIRTSINMSYSFSLEGQFQQVDYMHLVSSNLGEFLGSLMWLLLDIYLLIFLLKKEKTTASFKKLYKPVSQVIVIILVATMSILVFFVKSLNVELILALAIIPITLITVVIGINIIMSIKNNKGNASNIISGKTDVV